MSISFYIATPSEIRVTDLNVGNTNARELLDWVGLHDLGLWNGEEVLASSLAPACRRRLWDVHQNHDPELPASKDGRVIFCGRRPGYLRERTQELLDVCERAIRLHPDARIYWG